MRVRDLMTPRVDTVRPEATLNAAARKMWDDDIGAVPVVDDQRRLVGILTDRDICLAAYLRGVPLSSIPISEVMSTIVYTCRANDTIAAAERVMRDHAVRRLPVVDDEQHVVGILSLNDLARVLGGRRRGHGELVSTLAAIGTPRGPHTLPPSS